ncbi:TraR/DksA family transcriptional regulator (plasmid) [Pseudonocardia bannensis]|uniref:TraR/DksA family transcriptional regulator n=1 Tax=Pseudonocardia TaxID=1847 RepID=UPI0027E3224E|nr:MULTISPECIES: TraR/DksA C4-type zinc finger protein [Pseudonocardia]
MQALVEAGARRALDDIELALARIRTGDYGRCRACGAGVPPVLLEAIPQTTLCLCCHHRLSDGAEGRVLAPRRTPTRAVSARSSSTVARPGPPGAGDATPSG